MTARGRKIRAVLAGEDRADRGALPIGELMHPATLLGAVVLVVNDHILKRAAPGWLTGKLSDVAGLVVAPLLLTAVIDCALALAARAGADLDGSLRRRTLALACAVVGVGFALVELWPPVTARFLAALAALGFAPRAVADPTDLLALPALVLAYRIGLGEIARVPLGRIAVVARRAAGAPARARALLADVRRLARDPVAVDALADALADLGSGRDAARAEAQAALDRLRG